MKTIKVVAAIIKNKDKIMIAQRLKGDFAGQWEFPGGKVEKDETEKQAIEREKQLKHFKREWISLQKLVAEFLTTVLNMSCMNLLQMQKL